MLVSVGYAACHWCHVMAHESFEDEATAAQMNEDFVCVKVDREERPDVDSVYMAATQAMTGHGGWPMTVFTTPDGAPFYCGTYFPPRPAHGMPAFRQVLAAVADAWAEPARRARGGRGADRRRHLAPARPRRAGAAVAPTARRRRRGLAATYDERARRLRRRPEVPAVDGAGVPAAARTPAPATPSALRMAGGTARGDGARRHLRPAGRRLRPLLRGRAAGSCRTSRRCSTTTRCCCASTCTCGARPGADWARRVADETAAFLIRDLGTAEGGFASALDADTDGVEGLTYVWTPDQLVEVLGRGRRRVGRRAVRGDRPGHLRARRVDAAAAARPGRRRPAAPPVRARLRAARAQRPQPARDDKVVTAWNGLAIAALAEHGALTGGRSSVAAARRAAELLRRRALGRRPAAPGVAGRRGRRATPAVLEDYGDLAEGLLALHQATGGGALAGPGRGPAGRRRGAVHRRRRLARHRRRTPRRWCTARSIRPTGPTPAGIAAAAGAAGHLRRAGRLAPAPRAR